MKKRYIILAGNKNFDTRWNNHLGTSKHMIPIKGEPLIHRTQRLLLDKNQKDIIITCNKDNIGKYNLSNVTAIESKDNKNHIYPDYEFATTEGLLNPNGITVMLWGDLYLSENIVNKIVNDNSEDWHFYGRRKSSEITGSIYGEDFGWYFNNNHISDIMSTSETMLPILKKLVKDQSLYPWAMEDCSKMLYRMMAKIDYEDPHLIEKHHWIEIDDETEDFDYPIDWTRWSQRLPHLAF